MQWRFPTIYLDFITDVDNEPTLHRFHSDPLFVLLHLQPYDGVLQQKSDQVVVGMLPQTHGHVRLWTGRVIVHLQHLLGFLSEVVIQERGFQSEALRNEH